MNSRRTAPILDRLPHSESNLERLAMDALLHHEGVLPEHPGAVPIERLVEEAFGFTETYDILEPGVLGEIRFGIENRPLAIRLARRLGEINSDDPAIDHERRITLAHECGHGLAHAKIFADGLRRERIPLLPGLGDELSHIGRSAENVHFSILQPEKASTDEVWIEWEANYLMAALLLPRPLVLSFLSRFLMDVPNGVTRRSLPSTHRLSAITALANTFNVSSGVAASRLALLVPECEHPDLFDTIPHVVESALGGGEHYPD